MKAHSHLQVFARADIELLFSLRYRICHAPLQPQLS
jgi:hypothetical protein